jgi:SAM-dependent methyltransferase
MSDAAPDRDPDQQRRIVRQRYAGIASESGEDGSEGCCGADGDCCGDDTDGAAELARSVGYDDDALDAAGDANLGLGCGNPKAIADLAPGETVLDLGSGAGFDCFLAADAVGPGGRVVGVDMTPEMVQQARENAAESGVDHVEFRLGEIEHLPLADATVDAVISNCVINLSPDKPQVFREAFRALRPGGRLAVADVVQTAPFPPEVTQDPASLAACTAGAATVSDLEAMLAEAGFEQVAIEPKADSEAFVREWAEEYDPSDYLVSATIEAAKPA